MPTYRLDPSRPGRLVCQDCGLAVAGLPRRPCSPGRGCPPRWADEALHGGAEAAEPHRGRRLRLLGRVALVCGLLSFLVGVTALAGYALGVATLRMANADLARMGKGAVDPRGRQATEAARRLAGGGVGLSVLGCISCPGLWGVLYQIWEAIQLFYGP
ncbi:MAG TPA: hypothetical protein VJ739_12195 [Gemmataceae bacterium]|nr:hypothetical protein [Gemmataceae bacterium]